MDDYLIKKYAQAKNGKLIKVVAANFKNGTEHVSVFFEYENKSYKAVATVLK
jgi:hypothetical protein